MSATTFPTPAAQLSQGNAIEYKAYVRKFFETGGGTLFVIGSCYYGTTGFTLFFQENSSGQLCLMQQPPSGVVLNMVTYYVASWTSNRDTDANPKYLTIVDGNGEHQVHVKPWE